jgi:hypothetical protein
MKIDFLPAQPGAQKFPVAEMPGQNDKPCFLSPHLFQIVPIAYGHQVIHAASDIKRDSDRIHANGGKVKKNLTGQAVDSGFGFFTPERQGQVTDGVSAIPDRAEIKKQPHQPGYGDCGLAGQEAEQRYQKIDGIKNNRMANGFIKLSMHEQ